MGKNFRLILIEIHYNKMHLKNTLENIVYEKVAIFSRLW